ncbi:MAG: (2Fe-2S)-binding protein [Bdellovibrionales bacterium]|nr:(2Fe-2S)-binding protein [Bdellovibrionales bacterium]
MHSVLIKDLEGKTREFKLEDNEVIYDGLSRQGFEIPHGCLSGSCGSCKVLVCEGIENLSEAKTVESDTLKHIKENYNNLYGQEVFKGHPLRLSCRAKVQGDISLEILKLP